MTTTELRAYLDALDEGRLEWVSMTGNTYRVGNVEHMIQVLQSSDEVLRIAPKPDPVREFWMAIKKGWAVIANNKEDALYPPNGEPTIALLHITYDPNTRSAKVEVVGKEVGS